jgi:hypothetical protein
VTVAQEAHVGCKKRVTASLKGMVSETPPYQFQIDYYSHVCTLPLNNYRQLAYVLLFE